VRGADGHVEIRIREAHVDGNATGICQRAFVAERDPPRGEVDDRRRNRSAEAGVRVDREAENRPVCPDTEAVAALPAVGRGKGRNAYAHSQIVGRTGDSAIPLMGGDRGSASSSSHPAEGAPGLTQAVEQSRSDHGGLTDSRSRANDRDEILPARRFADALAERRPRQPSAHAGSQRSAQSRPRSPNWTVYRADIAARPSH
jgi:hypothetical protein